MGSVFAGQKVVVVEGLGGEEVFSKSIRAACSVWENAASSAGYSCVVISGDRGAERVAQVDRLRAELNKSVKEEPAGADVLWLVLIGHGYAQGKVPKFALEGPDLSAEELSRMLRNIRSPVVVVAGFSCAGAFVKPLSARGRLIVAATRSGDEESWTHFAKLFGEALRGGAADADGDGQVSVFEAWIYAGGQVEKLYKDEGRLLTEHAVLEDTGDGIPIELNAVHLAASRDHDKVRNKDVAVDEGRLAGQFFLFPNPVESVLTVSERSERESLEEAVRVLREHKMSRLLEDYQNELEGLLLKLAAIYSEARLRLGR